MLVGDLGICNSSSGADPEGVGLGGAQPRKSGHGGGGTGRVLDHISYS